MVLVIIVIVDVDVAVCDGGGFFDDATVFVGGLVLFLARYVSVRIRFDAYARMRNMMSGWILRIRLNQLYSL